MPSEVTPSPGLAPRTRNEIFRLCIEQPFVLFHASVTCCIILQIFRRDKGFRTGFFKLYVAQTFIDLATYYSWVCYLRLANSGIIPMEVQSGFFGTAASIAAQYTELLKYCWNVLISANRYKAISNPMREIQENKLVLVACFASPALIRGGYELYSNHCLGSPDIQKCIRVLIVAIYAVPLVYSVVCGVLSALLDVRTFLTFKAYNAVRRHEHKEDFLLLIYAMSQFFFMAVMTLCNAAIAAQFWIFENPRWMTVPTEIIFYNFDAICFSAPFCLLSTSARLRNAYLVMLRIRKPKDPVQLVLTRRSSTFQASLQHRKSVITLESIL